MILPGDQEITALFTRRAKLYSRDYPYICELYPTIKDRVTRLHNCIAFKLSCGFLVSVSVASEASYFRLITKPDEGVIPEHEQEIVVLQAIEESFITRIPLRLMQPILST